MAITTIAAKIGRTRLLLLILGAIASGIIAISMMGTASATHTCVLPAPHTELECNEILLQVQAEGYAAAATMATTPSPCFYGTVLCDAFHTERDSDIAQHLPAFRDNTLGIGMPYTFVFQEVLDAAIAAHLALPEHHAPPPPPSNGDEDDGDEDDGDDDDGDDDDGDDDDGDNDEDD